MSGQSLEDGQEGEERRMEYHGNDHGAIIPAKRLDDE